MVDNLKNIFGPKCSVININGIPDENISLPKKQVKLCESVYRSFNEPVYITDETVGCPGARRSLGFDKNDRALAEIINKNNGIPIPFILDALKSIPHLNEIKRINLGCTNLPETRLKPDLYIVYALPAKVTALMHFLAKNSIKPVIRPWSLLSVCGNVFSNTLKNNSVSISFGCSESRKSGGVKENEVVIGIPHTIAKLVTEKF